jgi:group I intron endonuclease
MQYKISDFTFRAVIPELRVAGIYKIQASNGKFYIGSASHNFRRRWKNHINDLQKNKHHSKYLQNIYNKYGEDSLFFEVVEIVGDTSTILEREQFWIDALKPELNHFQIAGSSLGYKYSEETKKKHRATRRQEMKQSSHSGITQVKSNGRYQAKIRIPNDRINLGFYDTYEEALEARLRGETLFWSEEFDSKTDEERAAIVAKFRAENNGYLGKITPTETILKVIKTKSEKKGVNSGVNKIKDKYEAGITVDGIKVYLGRYLEEADAIRIRAEAEQFYFSEDLRSKPKDERILIIKQSVEDRLFSSKATAINYTPSLYGKYITKTRSDTYNFSYKQNKHYKNFPTLEEAVAYKEQFLANLGADAQ